eukprot:15677-Eustigmatos_ZCMA.PRE.1
MSFQNHRCCITFSPDHGEGRSRLRKGMLEREDEEGEVVFVGLGATIHSAATIGRAELVMNYLEEDPS